MPAVASVDTDAVIGAEEFAFHQESFLRARGHYMRKTQQILAAAQNVSAAEYIRSRAQLLELRRRIDAAFSNVDLVVLPTRRHNPRTLESEPGSKRCSCRTGKRQHRGLRCLWHSSPFHSLWLHSARSAHWSHHSRTALGGKLGSGLGSRLPAAQ